MVVTQENKFYFSNNDVVAVAPLPVEQKPQLTGSVSSLMSKNEDLKPLTVLYNHAPTGLGPGDAVYLKPESYSAPYMGLVYQIAGQKFVLVPKEAIIAMVKSV